MERVTIYKWDGSTIKIGLIFNEKDVGIIFNEKQFSIDETYSEVFKTKIYVENLSKNRLIQSRNISISHEYYNDIEDLIFMRRYGTIIFNKEENLLFGYIRITDKELKVLLSKNLSEVNVAFFDTYCKKSLYMLSYGYLLVYYYSQGIVKATFFKNLNELKYVEPFE